jgi:hypothetical protein
LARRPLRDLILACIVSGEEFGPAGERLARHREELQSQGLTVRVAAFTSAAPGRDIVRLASEQDVDLVLLDSGPEPLRDPVLELVLVGAPCDVAIAVGARAQTGPVLVPFVGADHDWAAVELGAWIAGAVGAPLLLAGPREGAGARDASRLLADASLAVQRALGIAAEPLLLEPGAQALVAQAQDAGVIVVGLAERWREKGLGPVRGMLTAQAQPPVVLVRSGLRPGGLAPRESLTRFTWSLRS